MDKKNLNKYLVPALLVVIVLLLVAVIIVVFNERTMERKIENYFDRDSYNVDYDNDDNDDNDINIGNDIDEKVPETDTKDYISHQEAINIALKNIGLKQSQVRDLDCELDYRYNDTVYEVTFDYEYHEYEYYINAKTGKIIHSFKERD